MVDLKSAFKNIKTVAITKFKDIFMILKQQKWCLYLLSK
jgi:hypothetical protein